MFVVNRNIDIYVGSLVCKPMSYFSSTTMIIFFFSFSNRFYYALGLGRIIDVIFLKKQNGFS